MGLIGSLIILFNELIAKDPTMAVIVGTVLGAVVGAVVGAVAMFLVQYVLDRIRRGREIKGVLQGIYAELNPIYKQLTSSYAKEKWSPFVKDNEEKKLPSANDNLEAFKTPEESFFTGRLRIPKDYTVVYRSNANLIGQIKNSGLQNRIVRDYMFLQIALDNYQNHTKLLDLYCDDNGLIKQEFFFTEASDRLKKSTKKLLRDHGSITISMGLLLETLEEEIPLYGFSGLYRRFLRLYRRFFRFYEQFLTRSDNSA